MTKDERDQIDDLFDRSEWPPARTGRLPSEPNQQALPGTLAHTIEMAECRNGPIGKTERYRHFAAHPVGSLDDATLRAEAEKWPKLHCPLCDRTDGHVEGCGIETLNAMIDQDFLYGNVKEVSGKTLEDIKAEASKCKVIIVTGGDPLPPGLLDALRETPGLCVMGINSMRGPRDLSELQVIKAREAVGRSLVFDSLGGFGALLAEDEEVITGHGRLRAAELFRAFDHKRHDTKALFASNRSQTGKHGPYDGSFNRKKKKGRS